MVIKEREGQKDAHCILTVYDERKWLTKLDELNQDLMGRKLTITRLHFGDPTLTPLEKIRFKNFINFLCFKYPDQSFHTCYTPRTELRNAEKEGIIKESHGSIMAQRYGENKIIERARTLEEWRNMEDEIIYFVKKCSICQLKKTTRIKGQCEAIIPDTPVNPNDKIAIDIFGPLPQTTSRNEYILSIQDILTKYFILVPLKNAESETIIEELFDHYTYIFGSPKNILSDQGQNFVSELIQSFENLFRIKHVTMTTYHPQSNGAWERAYSTIKNLLKTSV